jgi:hypothetical protein
MVTIGRTFISAVWTTTYPGPLESAVGKMVTRSGYAQVFAGLGGELALPWIDETDPKHWSRFWASYLGKPERLRDLDADAAWDRVVPLQWVHGAMIVGSEGTDAKATVLVYPSVIVVIIRIEVTGPWPLDRLAASVAAVWSANDWSVTRAGRTSSNRNLRGIANELRDAAAPLLSWGTTPKPSQQEELTVAAPVPDGGTVALLDLSDETASSCLAGLAGLGPPGTFDEKYLLGKNSHPRRGSRVYVLKSGHAIWQSSVAMSDPIKCLHRNQTDLVAHISALAGIVGWAEDQAAAPGGIAVEVQPLVKRAIERLEQLHSGTAGKTYRSEIAKVRIEPLVGMLNAIKSSL